MNWYFVGLDLGQRRDPSAIAVLEWVELTGPFDPVMYAYRKMVALRLRFLERIELGTPYPDVVERVAQVTRSPYLRGNCHLAVDATGVGTPVVDLLRRAPIECRMLPVMITSGDLETHDSGYYRVPKKVLITGLQVLLQCGGLQIAGRLEGVKALVKEMQAMRVKVTLAGNEQYGAWREGEHDDMVFAVALACWAAKKMYPDGPMGDASWWRNQHQRDAAAALKKGLGTGG
jgi:hypothetical protein